jgi:hypothetical protein
MIKAQILSFDKAVMSHKYVKRSGSKGQYKYLYEIPSWQAEQKAQSRLKALGYYHHQLNNTTANFGHPQGKHVVTMDTFGNWHTDKGHGGNDFESLHRFLDKDIAKSLISRYVGKPLNEKLMKGFRREVWKICR